MFFCEKKILTYYLFTWDENKECEEETQKMENAKDFVSSIASVVFELNENLTSGLPVKTRMQKLRYQRQGDKQ